MQRRYGLAVILILVLVDSVSATDIYVSTAGSDATGDGSIGNPYATIGKCNSMAVSGDACQIIAGTYYNETMTVSNAISFQRYNGTVTLDNVSGSNGFVAFTISAGGGGANFSNLTIKNYKTAISTSGAGSIATLDYLDINTSGSGSHSVITGGKVYIKNSTIVSMNGNGVRLFGAAGSTVTNTTIICKDTSANDWYCLNIQGSGSYQVTDVNVSVDDNTADIFVASNNNVLTNITAKTIADHSNAIGIQVQGSNTTISNATATTTGDAGRAFFFSNTVSNTISDIVGESVAGVAITLTNVDSSKFTNGTMDTSKISTANAKGMLVQTGSDNNNITNFTLTVWETNNAAYAFDVESSFSNVFDKIYAYSYEDLAMKFLDSANQTVTNSFAHGGKNASSSGAVGGKGIRLDNLSSSTWTNVTGRSSNGNTGFTIGGASASSDNTFTNISGFANNTYGLEISSGSKNNTFYNPYGESNSSAGVRLASAGTSNNTFWNVSGRSVNDFGSNGNVGLLSDSSTAEINYVKDINQSIRIRTTDVVTVLNLTMNWVFNETSDKIAYCGATNCAINLTGTVENVDITPFRNLSVVATNSTVIVNDNAGANFTNTNNAGTVSQVTYRNVTNGWLYSLKDSSQTITTATASNGAVTFSGLSLADGYYKIQSSITYAPPTPVSCSATTGNFWINISCSPGTGNITDAMNKSVNGIWYNTTAFFYNSTLSAHAWQNVSYYAYNNSGSGTLNTTPVSQNTQIPNNAITISGISDTYNINAGNALNIDADYSDADSDTGTFARSFSNGTFDNSTGVLSWTTGIGDVGVYNWQINVSDGYGSTATKNFIVTITPKKSGDDGAVIVFTPKVPLLNKIIQTRVDAALLDLQEKVSYLNGHINSYFGKLSQEQQVLSIVLILGIIYAFETKRWS